MKIVKLTLIAVTTQVLSLLSMPIILYVTRGGPSMDGLVILGPLLVALGLVPIVIALCIVTIFKSDTNKVLWSQLVVWIALILNVGFVVYGWLT